MLNWSFVQYPDFLLVMSTATYVVLLQLSPLMNNKNWQIMQIALFTLVSPGIVGDISFFFSWLLGGCDVFGTYRNTIKQKT